MKNGFAKSLADIEKAHGKLSLPKPIVLRHLADIVAEAREPQWLIHKIVERNVLAVIAGPRGTFKSFIALDWAMRMAIAGHTGVILSGEGAGLDRRVAAWLNHHRESTDLASLSLVALERPVNLTSLAEMTSLCEAIKELAFCKAIEDRKVLDFIVIDTFSKFAAGLDENDNSQVAAFLSTLSASLREDFNCTVILVAHSGHGDPRRPRGASSLMSNPDCEFIVNRPDPVAMTVTVTRERFKDCPALPPLAYEAKVIDLGRVDAYGEPVTSLALVTTDTPPPSNAKGRGRNQEKIVVALREWQRNHPGETHIASMDLDGICKAQRLDRKRRREVLDSFVNAKVLTHAAGGYVIHPDHL